MLASCPARGGLRPFGALFSRPSPRRAPSPSRGSASVLGCRPRPDLLPPRAGTWRRPPSAGSTASSPGPAAFFAGNHFQVRATAAEAKTTIDVQTFSRRPRMWCASSTRMYSIQPRPDAVRGDVEGERPSVAELEAAVGPDDQQRDADAPQGLVEEGRVVGAGDAVRGRVGADLQRPRQIGRLAVQLLVEPVAPAADRLREGDTGRQGVGPRGQRDAAPAAADPGADRAERDRAPDTEAALPDLEGVDPVAGRSLKYSS